MKQREDPPIPRDMPPVAGKIAWARQLSRKLQEPMEIFKVGFIHQYLNVHQPIHPVLPLTNEIFKAAGFIHQYLNVHPIHPVLHLKNEIFKAGFIHEYLNVHQPIHPFLPLTNEIFKAGFIHQYFNVLIIVNFSWN